jgi:hypothetical protein
MVLLGAPLFNLGVDFNILVATVPVLKSEGFKQVIVLNSKIKDCVVVSVTFQFRGLILIFLSPTLPSC